MSELRPLWLEAALLAAIAALLVLDLVLPDPRKRLVGWLAATVCAALLLATFFVDIGGSAFSGAWSGDAFTTFFRRLFLLAGALGSLAAVDHLARHAPRRQGEYHLLLLSSVLGMLLLAGARDLLLLLVAFELMSVPLYLMAAYGKSEAVERSGGLSLAAEAGLKLYFVGAASTGFVFFGAALLAGSAGSTFLATIASAHVTPLLLLGAMMVLGGMAFKVGAAPFHMWVPDTYQGAQAPFVAFLSVAPKAAGIAALASVLARALVTSPQRWIPVVAVLAAASLLVGSLLAIPQTSARRLLAYSGVAQMGYVLIGLAAGTREGAAMVLFYLAAYVATNLGAFLVVHAVAEAEGGDDLSGFEGLSRRAPGLAFALLLLLLSLAGVPFVVGFWAKLWIFSAALQANLTWLVVLGAVLAVVGLFYYLRIIRAMYVSKPRSVAPVPVAPGVAVGIGLSALAAVLAGAWPAPLLAAARSASLLLFGG